MNGPTPVCTSARKKMNQSRPRKLWRDGPAGSGVTSPGTRDEPPLLPVACTWRSSSIRSIEWEERTHRKVVRASLRNNLQRLQAARRTKHYDRLILLVFGRRVHLLLRQFERDAVALVRD